MAPSSPAATAAPGFPPAASARTSASPTGRPPIFFIDRQVSSVGEWNYPPFAVRQLFSIVPFSVGSFETEDVVRAIRDGSAAGTPATCIDYDTIHGERRSSNELCLGKANSALLSVREEDRTYEYSRYTQLAGVGSLYPQHIEYRQGNRFSLSIDLQMSKLDSAPDDAFTVPAGAVTGTFCKTASPPVPLHAPQPPAQGGPDAAVTNVAIQLYVANDGTVVSPQVVHPVHPELDQEALKLIQTWTFTPPTCNGQPNTVPATVVLHFQGR